MITLNIIVSKLHTLNQSVQKLVISSIKPARSSLILGALNDLTRSKSQLVIVHFDVTRQPTDEWVAQQLREATPNEQKPKYLIRDNYRKFGAAFERVAADRLIEVLKTPIAAPKANALCERLMGTLRCECFDHIFVLGEAHLRRVLKEYMKYYNQQPPHHLIEQKIPEPMPDQTISTGKIPSISSPRITASLLRAGSLN